MIVKLVPDVEGSGERSWFQCDRFFAHDSTDSRGEPCSLLEFESDTPEGVLCAQVEIKQATWAYLTDAGQTVDKFYCVPPAKKREREADDEDGA